MSEFIVEAIVDLALAVVVHHVIWRSDMTNNKAALLVFYGLIIASVTVWVSLAVTIL